MSETTREQREWYINDDGVVRKAVGLSCAPLNPDAWWFASLGYTTCNVHATRELAVAAAIQECHQQIDVWRGKLLKLTYGEEGTNETH